jgi:hypothetical protein
VAGKRSAAAISAAAGLITHHLRADR